jgi:NAD(P)H-flavin reductase
MEGPYGVVPDTHEFDKIVLVAGGSGVTFTLALALEWARRRRGPKDISSLDFVWTVKQKASLDWFEEELAELHARSRVNVFLHVSGEADRSGSISSTEIDAASVIEEHKIDDEKVVDEEKRGHTKNSASTSSSVTIRYDVGRPNLATTVRLATIGLTAEDRVLVAGKSRIMCRCCT